MKTSTVLNAICRKDFYAFMRKSFEEIDNSQKFHENWHLELICDKLYQCFTGDIKRLIINIPPRNLKSHCVNICFPAFILGHKPSERIISVSYSQELASSNARKTRQLMETDFYKSVFKTSIGAKNTEDYIETTKNGFRYATSVEGTLTGNGGNFIIIDDPIKASDALSETKRKKVNDWYDNTLISRLNNKVEGVIVVVMQRLHVDDLTGHLLKQNGWEVLSLPAIAEEDEEFTLSTGKKVGRKKGEALNSNLEPLDKLEEQRLLMGEYNFSAQYQQRPIPEKGNVIDFEKFARYDVLPPDGEVFQSWDIALKDGKNNDYSVCVTAKYYNKCLYIMDIQRFKDDFSNLVSKITELYYLKSCNHLVIEESSVSTNLIQYLKTEKQIYPISYSPASSKVERANSAALYISTGQVLLPKEAIWLDKFKSEINTFPHGKHDDQVDALTQLILSALAKPNQISMMHETLYLNSLAKQGFTSAKEQYMIQKELEDYAEETTGSRVVSPDLQKLTTDALYHWRHGYNTPKMGWAKWL